MAALSPLSANLAAQSSTLSTLSANVAAQSSALSTQSSTLSTLSASVAALSPLSANVAALSAALSCGAGGRRLETDASSAPSVLSEPSGPSESTTAQTIVDDFLSLRPDLAGSLTADQRAGMEELGQHFGLPALA